MTTVNLNTIELNEFIGKHDPKQHCRATFPMFRPHGTKVTATVYFEIEPGDNLGMHVDNAEELLFIVEGEAEIIVGEEQVHAKERTIAHVPGLVPHDIINTGKTKLKVLGMFGGTADIIAKFDKEWLPTESRVIDTTLVT